MTIKNINTIKAKFYSTRLTSEKIFDFSDFYTKFSELYPNKIKPNHLFLEWFIGFYEGEGSFILAKRGDLSFVVTQSSSDINVLNYIKDNLCFGKVIVQSNKQKTHRFIVQDTNNLHLICELFNGNMVLPTRYARFISFISFFNERLLKKNIRPLIIKDNCVLPSLNNAWLSGFTDAEGCFTTSILSNSNAYRIRFILTQKWDVNKPILNNILNILSKEIGSVVPHSAPNVWELIINGIKNCKYLLSYFDKYNLQTKKSISYIKWKQSLFKISKGEHLNSALRLKLKCLSK